MHWCIDETLAVLRAVALLPLIGWWFYGYYVAWKRRHDKDLEHKCHDKDR